MSIYDLLPVDLAQFDGEGGGPAPAGPAGGETAGGSAPDQSANGVGGTDTADPAPTAEEHTQTPEERKAAYEAFKKDYKDEFAADIKHKIDRRMRGVRGMQDQLNAYKGMADMLASRYGLDAGDVKGLQTALDNDSAYWELAAEQAGKATDEYKRDMMFERQRRAFEAERDAFQRQRAYEADAQRWQGEAAELAEKYEGFDIHEELSDPTFQSWCQAVGPKAAYEALHHDEIVAKAQADAAAAAEKRIADNIKAQGQRPSENGSSSGAAFTAKTDFSKMSDKEFMKYWRSH